MLSPVRAGVLEVLAMQVSIGLALVAAAVGAIGLAGPTTRGQLVVFVICFAFCLPAAMLAGGQVVAALAARHSPTVQHALVGVAAAGILAVLLVARLTHALGSAASPVLIGGAALWALMMTILLRWTRLPARLVVRRHAVVWTAAALLTALAVVALLPARVLRPGPLALSLLIAAGLLFLIGRAPKAPLRPAASRALDAVALGLIVLSVMDVSIYLQYLPYDSHALLPLIEHRPLGEVLSSPTFLVFAQQLHHDFYLGPVNDVLNGRPMLVDTYSQYGVGAFYFLAVWFKLAPLGYGPMGLLAGGLTALEYVFAYVILRLAGCRSALAITAMFAAIVATIFGALGSVAHFPSTGGLRYLWAYLLIGVLVCGARWPAWGRKARIAALGIVGISATWSIEAMVYALVIFAAASAVAAVTGDGSLYARWRRLVVDVASAIACCLAACLLLAFATLAFAGRWPDWRPYLAFLGTYSGGDVGTVRLGHIHAWSAGFGLAALYFASALLLVTALVRRPRLAQERRPGLVAVAASTAFGIVALASILGARWAAGLGSCGPVDLA